MRDIKFRSWGGEKMLFNYQWIDSADPHIAGGVHRKCQFTDDRGRNKTTKTVGSNSHQVMQFTGLKDKDGVDIYEGDILQGIGSDIFSDVFFRDGSYHLRLSENQGSNNLIQFRCKYYEVAGNIYENPELIK